MGAHTCVYSQIQPGRVQQCLGLVVAGFSCVGFLGREMASICQQLSPSGPLRVGPGHIQPGAGRRPPGSSVGQSRTTRPLFSPVAPIGNAPPGCNRTHADARPPTSTGSTRPVNSLHSTISFFSTGATVTFGGGICGWAPPRAQPATNPAVIPETNANNRKPHQFDFHSTSFLLTTNDGTSDGHRVDRFLVIQELLPRVPRSGRLNLFRRQCRENEMRILRLPGQCLCLAQGQTE